ncbi:hypothetical protein [Massilia sp. ST3]|uniref:hypothetical protein n=1 Tax=Massilia sp. ST3 TaxID=2824903 RepID=UPI001B82CAE0|nr:hypothetical protein [Massilia sp. ST3]MBQ5948159.1 hypothetical protein [Massilia sp. ST3]
MATEHQPDQTTPPTLDARGAARRRLGKAGLGAAGVLWTLESKATMSYGAICVAPSAGLSGGLDSTYGPKPTCIGRSPGYWKQAHHSWPCSRRIKFSEVFPCYGANKNTYGAATMLTMLGNVSFDKYNLGQHLVANYLNVISKKSSFLSVKTLVEMWTELQSTGQYSPAPDVFWNAEETKRYLERTYGGS